MLLFDRRRRRQIQTNWSGRLSTSSGVTVTAGSTAHTLSSTFTVLVSSTNFDTDWVEIIPHSTSVSATNTDTLLNIYIGASGSEQLLIPNLLAGWSQSITAVGSNPKVFGFPLCIPKGSRLSAKAQSVTANKSVPVIVHLYAGVNDTWVGARVEALGANTSSSRGTNVLPGTTADGSMTSIGTSTFGYGFVLPYMGGNADTTMSAGTEAVDIGNASGPFSDLTSFLARADTAEAASMMSGGRFTDIPASTALYMRARFSGTAENKDYIIYGVG